LTAALRVGRLPARDDAIRAAEAAVMAADASFAQARRRLVELAPLAPEAAWVNDTLFNPGEWVPANTSIVSLLPPGRIKLRFFVPETRLAQIKRGQRLHVACDSCPAQAAALVTFIAPRAEYTPPVIYSIGSREKLVFMVEVRPDGDTAHLHPGLPVTVRP